MNNITQLYTTEERLERAENIGDNHSDEIRRLQVKMDTLSNNIKEEFLNINNKFDTFSNDISKVVDRNTIVVTVCFLVTLVFSVIRFL